MNKREITPSSMPSKAVDAIANPAPLTLAQIALYEKIRAPILFANIDSLHDNIVAVWIYKNPVREVARNLERREELALAWAESLSPDEYGNYLSELVNAVTAFYEMLPKGDTTGEGEGDGEKKKSDTETAGLANSENGRAGHTDTVRTMFLERWRQSLSRFFIVAFRRGSAR